MAAMTPDPTAASATQINATLQNLVQAINNQTQKAALIPYSTAASAGASAGLWLPITIGASTYKIQLFLP